MKQILTFLLLFLSTILNAQDVSFVNTEINGPAEEQIDFVIIGDGYTTDQMDNYSNDVSNIITKMSETSVFANNADRMNKYVIGLVSQEGGAGTWNEDTVNNALGSVFNYLGITNRLVRPLYDSVLVHILDSLHIEADQVLVLVNDSRRGGYGDFTGIPGTFHAKMSVASRDEMSEVAIHEMGHSWFGLSDEYVDLNVHDSIANNPLYDGPNVSMDTDSIEWTIALGLPDIGIYPGALYRDDRYRPSLNCMMRQTGQPFCSWCNFIMEYRITQLHPIIDPTGIDEPPVQYTHHQDTCSGDYYNVLGQKVPNPYGESVIMNKEKKKQLHTTDEKQAKQADEFEKLVKIDYVKVYRDKNGNKVRNLYQTKEFVMESGKVLHELPVYGCSYSE